MNLQTVKNPIEVPRELCWPGQRDQIDKGASVWVIEALPLNKVRVMTLAGAMIVNRDDIEPGPWQRECPALD